MSGNFFHNSKFIFRQAVTVGILMCLCVIGLRAPAIAADHTIKFTDLPSLINMRASPPLKELDALTVDFPANNSTFEIGKSIPTTVSVKSGYAVTKIRVYLAGTGKTGGVLAEDEKNAPPFQFVLTPHLAITGPYVGPARIVAEAYSNQGLLNSPSVAIDIEPSDDLVEFLVPQTPVAPVHFPTVGQVMGSIDVIGRFSDGAILNLKDSSRLTFTSANSNIAAMNMGNLEARGLGRTTINIRYGNKSADLPVLVGPKMNFPELFDLERSLDRPPSPITAQYNQVTREPCREGTYSYYTNLYIIKEIDTRGRLPESVCAFSMSYEPLDSFPSEIFSAVYLKKLALVGVGLTEIPAGISKLTNLRELQLSKNQLTRLPDEISKLDKLELLDLRSNKFTPDEISHLRNLLPHTKIRY